MPPDAPPKLCLWVFGIFYNCLYETFLTLGRMHRDFINVVRSSYKVPDIFVQYAMKLNSLDSGTEMFHVEGRADMTKPTVVFTTLLTCLKAPKCRVFIVLFSM